MSTSHESGSLLFNLPGNLMRQILQSQALNPNLSSDFLCLQHVIIRCLSYVIQHCIRCLASFSVCVTKTLYPLNSNFSSLCQPPFYSLLFFGLTTLDTSYKWNHAVFVLLQMAYFLLMIYSWESRGLQGHQTSPS